MYRCNQQISAEYQSSSIGHAMFSARTSRLPSVPDCLRRRTKSAQACTSSTALISPHCPEVAVNIPLNSACRRLRPQTLALALRSLLCAPALVLIAPAAHAADLPSAPLTAAVDANTHAAAAVDGASTRPVSLAAHAPSSAAAASPTPVAAAAAGVVASDTALAQVSTAGTAAPALAAVSASADGSSVGRARRLEGVEVTGREEQPVSMTALTMNSSR